MFRPVLLALALIAAAPGAFWLFYGTLEPCEAVATRGSVLYAEEENLGPEGERFMQLFGVAAFRAQLAGLSPQQCLETLWRLETGREPTL